MGNFMSTPFAIVIPAGCLCYLLVWAFENNNNLIRPSVGGVPALDAYGTCATPRGVMVLSSGLPAAAFAAYN